MFTREKEKVIIRRIGKRKENGNRGQEVCWKFKGKLLEGDK